MRFSCCTWKQKKVFSHANRVFCQKVARNAENAFEIFKLNKKRLEFLTPNLCGFGSRVKVSNYIQPSNLSSALWKIRPLED